jgi:putative ABC transport system substrate-binding protein
MRRRDFIIGFSGSAVALSLPARAQLSDGVRRIGVLMAFATNDSEGLARTSAFEQALRKLGWTESRNIKIDYRWAGTKAERLEVEAAQLIALKPDVLVGDRSSATAAMLRQTHVIPIVFARVTDPIGQGFVTSLARPGGNITGFMDVEPSMGGKWVELLKEIAPNVTRVTLIYNPQSGGFIRSFFASIEAAARSNRILSANIPIHDVAELNALISTQARGPDNGFIVPPDIFLTSHRDLIIAGMAQHHVPAIYVSRLFTQAGGLISYGADSIAPYRDAANYVDRILKGEKAADLPVQTPTKYELVINVKTAKALGLVVPKSLLATADEVIE